MSAKNKSRTANRVSRKMRVRKKVTGTDLCPRLCVYRSLAYTYAQLISDESNKILAAASTREISADGKSKQSVESAKVLGSQIAKLAKEKSVEKIVFDRNGYLYHGRVKAVADGVREAGFQF